MNDIPKINSKFFCIINITETSLAAVISSYVYSENEYTPILEFPKVSIGNTDGKYDFDEHYISITRGREFNIRAHNAIKRMFGCEYLILGGLSENQKSYLDFLDDYNTLYIDTLQEVDIILREICNKEHYTECKEEDILNGLFNSALNNSMLRINPDSRPITISKQKQNGIIVIEDDKYVTTVIAINYALSVNSDISIIKVPSTDIREIHELIERWQEKHENRYLSDLRALLFNEIDGIEFGNYSFATFFTFGAPYSLILENIIPITYVNNRLKPDFFVLNNLLCQLRPTLPSSIVFSPLEFEDEETSYVIRELEENFHCVKKLVGESATSYNIDNNAKEYPYEILHICSHGGEVEGSHMTEDFTDRDGNRHIVEYDEVVSFAPSRGQELIPVTIKRIWRKFDGHVWKSKELKEIGYPQYVFADMFQELRDKEGVNRKNRGIITDSCAIKCSDFNYQAMFNTIAGEHTNPFIFNNTCWSWYHIAESFISSGAIGYIGTLWAVDNDLAKTTAETFYVNVFENTILESLQNSMVHLKGTKNEQIYIYWGLHLARLQKGRSIQESRIRVAKKMLQSITGRKEQLNNIEDEDTKKQVLDLIKWNYNQLENNFFKEVLLLTYSKKK